MERAKICWEHGDFQDSIILEADTIEELQAKAAEEIAKRNPDNYWSESL